MRVFCGILALALACAAHAKPAATTWFWTIDRSPYTLVRDAEALDFRSGILRARFTQKTCLKPAIEGLVGELEKKVRAYQAPTALPTHFEMIELKPPGRAKMKIARGTDLGLFLLGFQSRISELRYLERTACK